MNWLSAPQIRTFIAWAGAASLLLNLALIVPAIYMLEVFDRVFSSRSIETLAMLTVLALLALGLGFCMDRARSVLLARAGRVVDEALSAQALAGLLSDAAHERARSERSAVQDIARMRSFLAGPAINALFDAPWLPLYLLVMFALHPAMGWAAVAAAALLFALGVFAEHFVRADAEQAATHGSVASHRLEALVRNAEVLVGMRMLGNAIVGWQNAHRQAMTSQERMGDAVAVLAATSRMLRQLVQVAMLALGAWLVVVDHASPGIMIAATVLIARALQPVEQLIAGWKSLIDVRAAWARLQKQSVDPARDDAMRLPALRGELSLERVVLVTDAQRPPLIKGVTLALEPGDCLGLIGPSAAGKTTLLRLMLGLRAPSAGTVRLDGVDLAVWPPAQLTDAIGYLPQDVELFAGSVAQNIARLGPVESERILEAARLAGVHEMIAALPNAYETEIGDAGSRLSGGQRQRIALARALYGNPKLVVLDEPNANLDGEGEDALAIAIDQLKQRGTTVVLVSHRPALMRSADKLAVLRDGALDLLGPREEVLARLAGTVHPLRRPAADTRQEARA